MSNRPTADFQSIISEAGIPVTAEDIELQLKQQVLDAGSKLSNDSNMSPFWQWVKAAVTAPVVWLINTLLVGYIMPNMFVASAQRWALELNAWEYNVEIKEAQKTIGYITLTKTNSDDAVTIEQGAIIQTLPIDGIVYQLQVINETIIEQGVLTGKILVEALEAGAGYNLPAGYYNILPVEFPGISAAINDVDWIITLGADTESDDELALRLQNAFTSAGSWHIDDAYRAIIASVGGIRSDNIYFENTGHITPGSANAYIVMEVGATPQSILDQLNEYIQTEGHHGHGDVLTCLAINDTQHNLIADVVLSENLTAENITLQLAEVENRIRASFRESAAFTEMTRANPLSRLSISQMSTEIHSNMPLIESVRITVDGIIQNDIISEYTQPRINSLVVQELS
jgi:hypothetical protein